MKNFIQAIAILLLMLFSSVRPAYGLSSTDVLPIGGSKPPILPADISAIGGNQQAPRLPFIGGRVEIGGYEKPKPILLPAAAICFTR